MFFPASEIPFMKEDRNIREDDSVVKLTDDSFWRESENKNVSGGEWGTNQANLSLLMFRIHIVISPHSQLFGMYN